MWGAAIKGGLVCLVAIIRQVEIEDAVKVGLLVSGSVLVSDIIFDEVAKRQEGITILAPPMGMPPPRARGLGFPGNYSAGG